MEINTSELDKIDQSLKLIKTYYNVQKIIGKGAFGIVYKAFELCSGRMVAIKQILINSDNKNFVQKEIELLKSLDHPKIVKYYNFLKEDNYMYLIMEYLEGGTVKEYIEKNAHNITEDIAREIIKQLLTALNYLHYSCDVCHRDIKPENIMFSEVNNISTLKLLDFGLSINSFEYQLKLQNCGTLIYMAPEQISNFVYSKAVDIWSVGIILYMLLNKGKNPFYNKGDSTEVVIERINNKDIEFDLVNSPISTIGRHFIYKLLDKVSSNRYSARLALKHPWITLNKFDKIPMTLYDIMLENESAAKLRMLFFTTIFFQNYKKEHLKMRKNEKKEKKQKNDDIFNLKDYEKRIINSNKLYEKKYKDIREKMFLPEYDIGKDINQYLFDRLKWKIKERKKEEVTSTTSINETSLVNDNIKKNSVNMNIIEKMDEAEGKIHKKLQEIPKLFESMNNLNEKSKYKKDLLKYGIPLKIIAKNKNNFINETRLINNYNDNNKQNEKKLSQKLIGFKFSKNNLPLSYNMNNKNRSNKNIVRPIKLRSIGYNNFINNEGLNKSKSSLSINSKIKKNNNNNNKIQNKKDMNNNNKYNRSNKSLEKYKNESKKIAIDSYNRNNKSSKLSTSVYISSNNSKKKALKDLSSRQINTKKEFGENDSRGNKSLMCGNKRRTSFTSNITSIKKSFRYSSDRLEFINPKNLFSNNSILPAIKKK